MMYRTRFLQLIIGLVIIVLGFGAWQMSYTPEHVDTWTEEAEILQTDESGADIREQIKAAAEKNNEPPIDAVIDDVWKGIPGYNGRVVDQRASFENMIDHGRFVEDLLVFQEVPPEVKRQDLPPVPYYKANPNKPMAAFIINVAWGNEHLPAILKTLNEKEVRATFFLDGSWVRNYPRLARMIKEQGHEVGNHAYSHPDMSQLSSEEIRTQLENTSEIIEATVNEVPSWFAPPSGSFTQEVVEIAYELNMYTVLWTVDTIDWKNPDTQAMVERVRSNIHPGATILMHPTKPTTEGLDDMIEAIRAEGLELGPVSSVMDEKRIVPQRTESEEPKGDEVWYNARD